MGDFNLNLLKPESNSDIPEFENFFMSEGLYPAISLATHKRSSSHEGTCIDNIFTNDIEDVCISGVMDCCGAKHMPIFTQSNLNFDHNLKGQQKQKCTQFYSFSKKNTDSLLEILKDSHDALIGSDPNSPDFSSFFETFTVSIDKACKLDIPKTTIRNAINNPWITDGIINAVKEKDYL